MIVAAYAPPGIEEDLKKFDRAFGLPDPALQIVAPQGAVWDSRDPNQLAWASEIDSDVQWAHAIAPEARIVLVEARSDDDHDLAPAVAYAVQHRLGDVISQSFGEDERCTPPKARIKLSAAYRKAAAARITVVASSGDTGAGQFVCDPNSGNLRKGAASPRRTPGARGGRHAADGRSELRGVPTGRSRGTTEARSSPRPPAAGTASCSTAPATRPARSPERPEVSRTSPTAAPATAR